MKQLLYLFLILSCAFIVTENYKILGVFPSPAHSHYTLGFRLMKELADRGHEVVFINSHPQKKNITNYRDVSVEEIIIAIRDFQSELTDFGLLSYPSQLEWMARYGRIMSTVTFTNKNVQALMKSDEKFDLVIVENFVNEAMAIFAHRFNCPFIVLAPGPMTVFNNFMFANPAPSSYVTNLLTGYDSKMNFWQRLDNTYKELVAELFVHFRYIPIQNEILQEVFPGSPDLSSIISNGSLMLIISHISLNDPVPLQQNIKQIGGYHVLPPKPLSGELQEFMDNSTEGVVVFSMGSNLKSSNFEPDKRKAILNAFSKIKQKVLWKFEEDLPEKPKNVRILKWLPQSDVLAHPNTVLFISHGGLLGTTEAVYHGVPILGIPVFWDQERNTEAVVRKGFGLKVNYHNINEESFQSALNEILDNPKYKEVAKERSLIMHDQPMKQMDEAIFWCEYVIRHKGAPFLKSAALHLRWYQLYLLDIIFFIILIVLVIFVSFTFVFNRLFRRRKLVAKEKKNK